MSRYAVLAALVSISVALAASASASAQSAYPARPIQMIVPLQAASAVDNAARLVAQRMSENMHQSIVVENQPGAAGLIGTEKVARAAPDGYVIGGFNDSIMTMLPNLHAKMSWNILKDFEPVSLVASMEWGMVVPPGSPFHTVADVIAAAKAHPGSLNYSSGGNGSPQHVAMELFKSQAGIFLTHIPYRGATAAALDAASGQVDVHLSGLPTVFGMIKGGKLRLLGVGSAQRLAQFPEVPTIDEAGVKGYRFNSFYAIVAPAGTPAPVIKRLHDEAVKAALAPDVNEKLVAQGFVVRASSPEDLAAATREQLERYGQLFKTAGIRVD